ncbi:hypothetical protein CA13_58360 [Planctomycetes bacterium CA13]|uniref:Uncharacterized protein n=1 Tax=Novipirellula herctigrandis TaxID=2527986 RepID=A0A5C5ZAG1_9BACT|nr:hypothetical protein CA13_58360 [Planctomycetes bacterium CA13]
MLADLGFKIDFVVQAHGLIPKFSVKSIHKTPLLRGFFCVSSTRHESICVSSNEKYDPQAILWIVHEPQKGHRTLRPSA